MIGTLVLWKSSAPTTTLRNGTPNYGSWLERPTPIYKTVTLFQSEQAVTEISLMQLAAGQLPKRRIRKYRNHGKRLTTINEEYEPGDYTL